MTNQKTDNLHDRIGNINYITSGDHNANKIAVRIEIANGKASKKEKES